MSRYCVLIPTYNNVGTAADVVRRALRHLPVLVVLDGPTDGTRESICQLEQEELPNRLTVLDLAENHGKGHALKSGLCYARELGYTHVVTLDSDGQHATDDIPKMVRASQVRPDAIVVGSRVLEQENMPAQNTFANRFSNFWFALQTTQVLPDTQSGFRVYPLHRTHGISLMTSRYEAELILLVFSAWANTPIVPCPVSVYYPPREERVSFFRPGMDFTRISILNTVLCVLALVYGIPRRWSWSLYYLTVWVAVVLYINVVCAGLRVRYGNSERFAHLLRLQLQRVSRFFLSALPGCRYTIRYTEGATPITPKSPSIIISNHTSLLDVLAIFSMHNKLAMVGKSWVAHNIFFGRIAKAMGIITIENGYESLLEACRTMVEKGYSVVVFPEGTRTLTGEVRKFHRGAFWVAEQLNLPIRPILLRGMLDALPKSPMHVGCPDEMSVTIYPEVQPDNTAWGTNYRERSRAFHRFYCNEIVES